MPFYVSHADATGARVSGTDYFLAFTPTGVEYPSDALGVILETTDGAAIQQQPNLDGRRRAWVWRNYRETVPGWADFWIKIEGLRSRTLIEAGAVTPYIFVKEDLSRRLRRRDATKGTATAGSTTTLSTGTAMTTNQYAGGEVVIVDGTGVGQTRKVVSNTSGGVLSIDAAVPFSPAPDATSKYEVRVWVYDWFRARVIEVSRTSNEDGGQATFPEARMVFVIDDATYNDIG